ncbi:MAG: Hsp70 family protein [Alphaproteobacteria bacterium]|nr:Hsp70 family protein [Alphaproteobacteria bacterium]
MPIQLVEPGQTPDLHDAIKGVVVGIDLGTTHSVVASVPDKTPEVIGSLISSTLSLDDEGFCVANISSLERLSSTKRFMGQNIQLKLGSHTLTPVEVASHILSHIRERVEKNLGVPLEAAVITVPAYFDEAARVATKQAAALAGIKVLRLINEPTAAALAYGLETGAEGLYAIYDLGGGTFDLSLLKLQKGVFQVLATGGDLALGGDDIDEGLAKYLETIKRDEAPRPDRVGQEYTKIDPAIKSRDVKGKDARTLKETLSQVEEVDGITRKDLEAIARPFVQKTLEITARVFKDATLNPKDIQGVVLVGGMTRMPLVRQEVEAFFGAAPLCNIDPDRAVALGAAISAHGLVNGSDTLLLDVTPLSLGLEIRGGLVEKIIPRNTPLPALASSEFTTQEDGQGGMVIHVLQGEREFVQDCRSLARFELKGLPPLPAGMARVRVDFAVDVEGLLTVSALEKTTGLSQHVEVRPSSGLDDKTLADILLESQKYGRQDMEKRLRAEKQ